MFKVYCLELMLLNFNHQPLIPVTIWNQIKCCYIDANYCGAFLASLLLNRGNDKLFMYPSVKLCQCVHVFTCAYEKMRQLASCPPVFSFCICMHVAYVHLQQCGRDVLECLQ